MPPPDALLDSRAFKEAALNLGFTTAGVCPAVPPPHFEAYRKWIDKGFHGQMSYLARHLEAKSHPRSLLQSARSMLVVTLGYNQPNPFIKGKPRIARYALGRDYHKVVGKKLKSLAAELSQLYPNAEFRACVDSAPIMERDFAYLAGLGWFGKNTCLIDSRRGSWFFIGLLLTSLPLRPDEPAIGGCGSCRKCVDACPTGAIVYDEGRWQIDSRRCISYLTIEHKGPYEHDADLAGWTFGCDVCQEVCPFNLPRPSQPLRGARTEAAELTRLRQWPALPDLAEIEFAEWDLLTRGSAVRRAGWDGLRRNARENLH